MYAPVWNNRSARFNVVAVVSHFVNGLPPVESFRIPDGLHCTVPNAEVTYGVMSTIIWFRILAAAVHLSWSANRSIFWSFVLLSFWQLILATSPELSHFSIIWLNSFLWLWQLFGSPPVFTLR